MQGSLRRLRCSAEGGLASLVAWPIFLRLKPVLMTILTEVHRAGLGTYCARLSTRFEIDWACWNWMKQNKFSSVITEWFQINACYDLIGKGP